MLSFLLKYSMNYQSRSSNLYSVKQVTRVSYSIQITLGMVCCERERVITASPPPKGEYFVSRKFKYIHEWTLLHDLTHKKIPFLLSLPPAFSFCS